MPVNGVILQGFHWYSKGDGHFWNGLATNGWSQARRIHALQTSQATFQNPLLPTNTAGPNSAARVGRRRCGLRANYLHLDFRRRSIFK